MLFSSNDAHKKVDRSSSTEAAGTGNCLGHPSLLQCRASFNKQKIVANMRYRRSGRSTTATPQRRQPQKSFPSASFVQLCRETPFSFFRGGRPFEPKSRRKQSASTKPCTRFEGARKLLHVVLSKNAVREMAKQHPYAAILTTLGDGVSQAHSHRHARCSSSSSQIALSLFCFFL